MEAENLELELSNVNMRILLETSLNMIKEKAMKHGLQFSMNIEGIQETIRADEEKLKQIIYNLLDNAVKYVNDFKRI